MNPELQLAVDEHGVVHWRWRDRGTPTPVAVCSTVTNPIVVKPTWSDDFLTCLRCLDIEARFW